MGKSRNRRKPSNLKEFSDAHLRELLQAAIADHQGGYLVVARKKYERILAVCPDQPDALHYIGVLALQEGDAATGEQLIRRAIARQPVPVMWKNLSVALSAQGRCEEAGEAIRQAWEMAPENMSLAVDLAKHFLNKKEWARALPVLKELANHDSIAHSVLLNIANCYMHLQQYHDAELQYLAILNSAPDFPEANSNLGALYVETDRAKKGLYYHLKAVSLAPEVSDFLYNLGQCYWALGRLGDALSAFERAVAIDPFSVRCLTNLGTALQILGQIDRSLEVYSRAQALRPNDGLIHVNLGNLFLLLRRYNDAIANLQQGIALNPDSLTAWITAGETFNQLGRLDEAREALNIAISKEPRNGLAWLILSKVEEKANCFSTAERALIAASVVKQEGAGLTTNMADQRAAASFILANFYGALGRFSEANDALVTAKNLLLEKHPSYSRYITEPRGKRLVLFRPIGRAGSLFMHSLMDGHPQISTTPSVIMKGFFSSTVWSIICPSFDDPNWRETLVDRFLSRFAVLMNADNPSPVPGNPLGNPANIGLQTGLCSMGRNRDIVLRVNSGLFREIIISKLQGESAVSTPRFFDILHDAWDSVLGWPTDKPVLFFHIHNPGEIELGACLVGFDDIRFLNIIREPLQAVESWMKLCVDDNVADVAPDLLLLSYHDAVARFHDTIYAASHSAHLTYPSATIRLEDVKRMTTETLESLASWIGVEYHESLRNSTFAGLEYYAPSSTPIVGFDTSNLDRKPGILFSEYDQRVMNILLYPISVQYGYRSADAGWISDEVEWYKPRINHPLDFERKIISRIQATQAELDITGPRRQFESVAMRCLNLLEQFGTYPAMAPWLKVK